jgi:hypothetical protein
MAAKWEIYVNRRFTLRVASHTIDCGALGLNVQFFTLSHNLPVVRVSRDSMRLNLIETF